MKPLISKAGTGWVCRRPRVNQSGGLGRDCGWGDTPDDAYLKWELQKARREAVWKIVVDTSDRWQWGTLFRWESAWIGCHYSPYNKRYCINLIPFVTIWITKPGGKTPSCHS